jgi:hypothetical protein
VHTGSRTVDGSERGVSTVVGTVLLVAIVVGLAGVVGTTLTTVGTPADRPEVAFGVEFEDDAGPGGHDVLRIVHRGGESVLVGPSGENEHENPLARNLFIVSTHSFEDDTVGPGFECSETDPYVCPFNFDDEFSIGGERMAAGDTYRLYGETPSTPLEDATLRIVWRSEGRAESQVLFEWNGPGA